MEENNNTKQLMRLYFGKHFSRYGRILFGRWLKADNGKIEKEEILQVFWEKSQPEATASTHSDWETLQRHLSVAPVRERSVPLYRQWLKYAAVIALLIMTAGITYWTTDNFKPARHVEMAQIFVPYG